MHDVAVTLDIHHLSYAHRAEIGDAANIIARKIDKHDVLGPLFWIGEEFGGIAFVLGDSGATAAGPQWAPSGSFAASASGGSARAGAGASGAASGFVGGAAAGAAGGTGSVGVFRADVDRPLAEGAPPAGAVAPGSAAHPQGQDPEAHERELDRLADDVYERLRWRLNVERERLIG